MPVPPGTGVREDKAVIDPLLADDRVSLTNDYCDELLHW
jgi:hypothetical protein